MKSEWKRSVLFFLYLLSVYNGAYAGQWQPLCLAEESCIKPGYKNSLVDGSLLSIIQVFGFILRYRKMRSLRYFA